MGVFFFSNDDQIFTSEKYIVFCIFIFIFVWFGFGFGREGKGFFEKGSLLLG